MKSTALVTTSRSMLERPFQRDGDKTGFWSPRRRTQKGRYMTVREAKLIQTFPPNYKISGKWGEALRQIGNAVPVHLAEIIGKQLVRILSEKKQNETDAELEESISIVSRSSWKDSHRPAPSQLMLFDPARL